MKNIALITALITLLLSISSCIAHRTCPTYMQNNSDMEGVSASVRVK